MKNRNQTSPLFHASGIKKPSFPKTVPGLPPAVKKTVYEIRPNPADRRPGEDLAGASLSGAWGRRMGFTLMELLVVVLIIGILAAVAVPLYEKAVWKSRAVQLLTAVKSVAQAQEAYFMANGTYAAAFGQLDISFDQLPLHPGASSVGLSTASADAVRGNENFEVVLNNAYPTFVFTTGIFKKGPYGRQGFMFVHTDSAGYPARRLACVEHAVTAEGSFCVRMFGSPSVAVVTAHGYRYYIYG